jgi:ABC-type lipoprotein release transport system permease subunit
MSNAADKLLEEAQNLESPTVRKIAHNFKKVGFVIGRVGNSITEGVVLGISSKNEETIKEVAKKAD